VVESALDKARAKAAELRAAGVAPIRLDPIEKAQANPRSLRAAINGKCWDCVGAASDPNPRGRIGACASVRCPLYPVRPYQLGDSDD
jgi:hypothetical protein